MEDEEAVILFWEILKYAKEQYKDLIKRVATQVAGSCDVVNTLEGLAKKNRLPNNSMAIIDGDKRGDYPDCPSLPGDRAPERMVFEDFKKINWDRLDERFGIGAGTLYQILDDAVLLPNHHEWTTYVGDKTKKSRHTVWQIMVEEWCRQCMDEEIAEQFVEQVIVRLERG